MSLYIFFIFVLSEFGCPSLPDRTIFYMKNLIVILALLGFNVCLGQSVTIRGRIVDAQRAAIPFANVALFRVSDTLTVVCGTASDLEGRYSVEAPEPGEYRLKVSYLGYRSVSQAVLAGKDTDCEIRLEADPMAIGEVVVEGKRNVRSIDKTSYLFTKEQVEKASDGCELVATLPNLRVDRATNALATVNGKSILILINGIRASDEELRLIPADKVRNVELYDVPPIRYMNDAEQVVNIRTRPLDTGWSGNLYGTLGQMFSNASVTLSYIKGDNRLTFSYGTHINMKRDKSDLETGHYDYQLNDDSFLYDYVREIRDWGQQHNVGLTYLLCREGNYDLQIRAFANTSNDKMDASKRIVLTQNAVEEALSGQLTDRKQSIVPTLDVYFAKQFGGNNSLALNLVGSYFDNGQQTRSLESGPAGFDDRMDVDNRKRTLIGEVVYGHRFKQASLSLGYRSHYNFLTNELTNSLSDAGEKETIHTQAHRLYAEISGKARSFLYRVSLGANYDVRTGRGGFHNLTFTPMLMTGYNFGDTHTLCLMYESETQMPEMLQMSDARILIMNNFYQTGNPALENAHRQSWRLSYDLYVRKFTLQAALFYDYTRNSLFDAYRYGEGCILYQTDNAERDILRGGELNLNFTPWKFLRIGGSVEAAQQLFRPSRDVPTYRYWTFPVSVYVSANYKNFALDIYQKFGGTTLVGLYRTGIEKVSYVSLGYRYRNLNVAVQCFFPFVRDRYSNETIPTSIVRHKTDYEIRRKDHALALSLSWRFGVGRKKASVRPELENYDNDSGLFKIK